MKEWQLQIFKSKNNAAGSQDLHDSRGCYLHEVDMKVELTQLSAVILRAYTLTQIFQL